MVYLIIQLAIFSTSISKHDFNNPQKVLWEEIILSLCFKKINVVISLIKVQGLPSLYNVFWNILYFWCHSNKITLIVSYSLYSSQLVVQFLTFSFSTKSETTCMIKIEIWLNAVLNFLQLSFSHFRKRLQCLYTSNGH